MKCAFCGEEFEGSGYKVSGDMRVYAVACVEEFEDTEYKIFGDTQVQTVSYGEGSTPREVIIKDMGDVCSRSCQIASKTILFALVNIPVSECTDTEADLMFNDCDCTIEEFTDAIIRYNEVISRKILMITGESEKYL